MELFTQKYRRYVLAMLFFAYTLNFLDRQLMSILVEPIKLEFQLTDAQMGILTGIAFAFFYTILGFPMARIADRGNRVTLISVCLFIWSLFTALTGLVTGFWQLLLTRIFVGIGEAGCTPPAYSLISDYYPAEKRGRALSIYSLGIPFGIFCGLLIGGIVAAKYGWRAAFFTAGLPGVIMAFVIKKTIRSLPRGYADNLAQGEPQKEVKLEQSSAFKTIGTILKTRTFLYMALGASFQAMVAYGVNTFLPSFLMREYGIGIAEVGVLLAFIYMLGGGIGMYFGGALADRLSISTGNTAYYIRIPIVATLLLLPSVLMIAFSSKLAYVFIAIFFANIFSVLNWGPTAALSQRLTRLNERAMGVAILFFLANFIGLGFGPVIVGFLSELYNGMFIGTGMSASLADAEGLRYAFYSTFSISLIACFFYFLSSRHLKKDLQTFSS